MTAALVLKNSAFVFVKPHAVSEAVKDLVKSKLEGRGITILRSGKIDAATIDKQGLIDAHYGAIASRAMKQKPAELVVQPEAKAEFEKLFKVSWEHALEKGLVFNAADAAAKLGIAPLALSEKFDKTKRGESQVKFGGGFYVGKIDDVFVVNGFYTRMRSKYTTAGTSIFYYEVEWNAAHLSWASFRGEVIGATNPKEAKPGSIRHDIFLKWSSLGLAAEPDTGDNGVHASASPFEGLVEKGNWLGVKVHEDALGKALLAAGIGPATIDAWKSDPAVDFGGSKRSLFDLFEDLDAGDVVLKAVQIARGS